MSKIGSKFTVEFWRVKLFRPKYYREGKAHEVLEWHLQIQFGGRREKVGLGSNSREDCARQAAKFYKDLLKEGWEKALEKLSPDRKVKPKVLTTVGDVLEALRPGMHRRTFDNYASHSLLPLVHISEI
jgi:predicted YcjX-like family ATPase